MKLGERSEKSAQSDHPQPEPGWSLRRHETRSHARLHRHPGAPIAARFTLAELAVLSVIARQCQRGGVWKSRPCVLFPAYAYILLLLLWLKVDSEFFDRTQGNSVRTMEIIRPQDSNRDGIETILHRKAM